MPNQMKCFRKVGSLERLAAIGMKSPPEIMSIKPGTMKRGVCSGGRSPEVMLSRMATIPMFKGHRITRTLLQLKISRSSGSDLLAVRREISIQKKITKMEGKIRTLPKKLE